MKAIELLAPARDLQTGIEAIRHGADAVYIGAPKFGARAAAGNSIEDIRTLVNEAHPYGVKIYVTLNTLLRDEELEEARQLAWALYEAEVDALIIQDLKLLSLDLPPIPLHASTQMDNQTAEKVEWLWKTGFTQAVLARELTLDEIREIHERVPQMPLEVFVHGAICVCYNGRCFASEHCFGRSANRGECAQFCRLPFDLIEGREAEGEEKVLLKQKYLLSMRDMNRSKDLETLLDAGVTSLKIEGRLKDTAYVKNITAYYRQQLDSIFRRRSEYCRSSIGKAEITFTPNPAKSFNRLFTDYFLHGRTSDMANIYTPKSMGEPIGWRNEVTMPIHSGDGLCFINENGELEGFRVNNAMKDFPPHREIKGELYRNHDQQFEQLLSKPTATRKVGVKWLLQETANGFLLRMTTEDGKSAEQNFVYPHEVARSPQHEQIAQQLARLGDTPYTCTGVDIETTDNWFIPRSVLAEWRRSVICNIPSTRPSPKHITNNTTLHINDLIERQRKPDEPNLLMICRYCIRHELGMCRKSREQRAEGGEKSTLFLRLSDGQRFRLQFDCKRCQMRIYALNNKN
ncbi:MAG: U32 family peptidase [Bacteroidaceae bacterium]|nr:U32 family peptidase [Bacteroidaceae bacterium]